MTKNVGGLRKCATCSKPFQAGDLVRGAEHDKCLDLAEMTCGEVAEIYKAFDFDEPDYTDLHVGPTPNCKRCQTNPLPISGRCAYCELDGGPVTGAEATAIIANMKKQRRARASHAATTAAAVQKQRKEATAAEHVAMQKAQVELQAAQVKAEQARVMQDLMKPGTDLHSHSDRRGLPKPTGFTLFGKPLKVGSPLDAAERAGLKVIADNPATDPDVQRLIRDILNAAPEPPSSILAPVEDVPLPPDLADEMTLRAREALIASGDFPGADYELAIRSGQMDSLSGVRAAIQVLRDMGTPVEALRQRQPREKALVEVVRDLPQPLGAWGRFGRWVEHLQHRFVRLWSHYESAKARNLLLAGQIVTERRNHVQQVNLLQNEVMTASEKYQKELDSVKKAAVVESDALKVHIKTVEEELRQARVEIGKFRLGLKKQKADEAKVPHGGSGIAGGGSDLERFVATARPEERAALLELAKHALAARRIDPHTDQIVLSMVVKKFHLSKDADEKRPLPPPPSRRPQKITR